MISRIVNSLAEMHLLYCPASGGLLFTIHLSLGLFDRAKKKFLGDKEGEDVSETSKQSSSVSLSQSTSLYDVDYWQPQEIGMITDKMRYVVIVV